jgi:transposase InsO family protein
MLNTTDKIIRNKVGLLNLAEALGNVSKACKVMGYSRETFYRYKEAVETGGVEALFDRSRRKPNLANRVDQAIEERVVAYAIDYPTHGQLRTSNELRKIGVFVSSSGVRSIWVRNALANRKQRLTALEKKMAEQNFILTEVQVVALEKKKEDDVACGEIETHHPGYLGSQDTFYVGTFKRIGRVYQQTFVDTYSKVACCKLYTTKTPITSADLLNDRVLPLFESYGMTILRMLTDRGTEFCGKLEQHDYELYLGLNNIEHTKTKAYSPQTNGICERFHKTILEEFYEIALRKKVYDSIDELQKDLDDWVSYYNHQRTHQGKMCCGRTPMQTLLEGKKIWQEKVDSLNLA